jgi:FkbM family methyltransferase
MILGRGTVQPPMKAIVNRCLGHLGLEVRRKGFRVGAETFEPFVENVSIAGIEFCFWVADSTGKEWYEPTEHESYSEHTQTARLIKRGDAVLEIGTHHGFTMMLLSKLVGDEGRVLGVEPSPHNAMIASAQIGLNAAANCRVIQAAAANRKGRAKITFDSNAKVTESSNGIEVTTVTVDELDSTFGPFDVLKVDVEGFERQVLLGASALLKRRPRIILELHSPLLAIFGSTVENVLSLLGPASYQGTFVPRKERDHVNAFSIETIPRDDIANLFLAHA